MPKLPPWDRDGLARLAAAQDGVVDRAALAVLGVTSHHVRHRVATQRWQVLGPRVVVLHHGPLTERQRLWAGVLHAGADAALRGLSAAVAAGLTGFGSPVVQVVVPHGHHVRGLSVPGLRVRVRQSRHLDPEGLDRTSVPRQPLPLALVDAAARADTDGRARLVLLSAVQQRLVRPDDLYAVLDSRPRLRRRALLAETVGDAAGGAHSLPEQAWLTGLRRAGLPEPTRQLVVQRANGRWYLDGCFEEYDVAYEIDGSQHDEPWQADRDRHRRNVLATSGKVVLGFDSYSVRRSAVPYAATAAAVLARGWTPSSRVRDGLERLALRAGIDLRTGDHRRPA